MGNIEFYWVQHNLCFVVIVIIETNHELPIKLFGRSIALHCVLHVGLQYCIALCVACWSAVIALVFSIELHYGLHVLRCVLHYCMEMYVACWTALLRHYTLLENITLYYCVLHVGLHYCIAMCVTCWAAVLYCSVCCVCWAAVLEHS